MLTPTRKRPFQSLSPDDKMKAYKKEKVALKVMKQKHYRLIAKLESKNKSLVFNHDSSAMHIMQDAIKVMKRDWGKTTYQILAMIMELDLEDSLEDKIDDNEKK